jgi:chaperone modulatory protein CbpM
MTAAAQVAWLDARETVTVTELSRVSGLTASELQELVEYGALAPVQRPPATATLVFSAACVAPLRHAVRLRRDFDLDLFMVSMLLDYLQRIEDLQKEVRSLKAQLPKHAHAPHHEGPEPWHEPHG